MRSLVSNKAKPGQGSDYMAVWVQIDSFLFINFLVLLVVQARD